MELFAEEWCQVISLHPNNEMQQSRTQLFLIEPKDCGTFSPNLAIGTSDYHNGVIQLKLKPNKATILFSLSPQSRSRLDFSESNCALRPKLDRRHYLNIDSTIVKYDLEI